MATVRMFNEKENIYADINDTFECIETAKKQGYVQIYEAPKPVKSVETKSAEEPVHKKSTTRK